MSERATPGTAVMDPHGAPCCNIACPNEPGRMCTLWVKPAQDAEWENHGTKESPTITPSYNCVSGCGWHGYIVDGKLTDAPQGGVSTMLVCAACKHPEILTVHVGLKDMGAGRIGADVKMSKTVVREISSTTPSERAHGGEND